jgi:hypothetical protein
MNNDLAKLSKEKLMSLVTDMGWNDAMGCHTRAGFEKWIWPEIYPEARFLVYFDVDGVHRINKQHKSYDPFDAMMKQVLGAVRTTDIVSCQYKSGDEYLLCLCESHSADRRQKLDPEGLVKRLTEELARQGLTATFTYTEVKSPVLTENVNPLADKVLELKEARGTTR